MRVRSGLFRCRLRGGAKPAILALGLVLGGTGGALAEPPIQSAQDAFCRSEARAQVFSAPDPLNIGLREIGRQIWASCMSRGRASPRKVAHRRRSHRR